uniref:Translation initiation factor 1 n=1 Tax=Spergula arvensis TaxID=325515 RepID=A0A411L0W5_9CARY|nr:translation initiation factor 1 [Spergula arvensis]QBE85971.1 translation initiation factor 1 [Spergula arvensis]
MKEQKKIKDDLITASLPNSMFWVHLDNEDVILDYIFEKIRRNSIQILPEGLR